jgi:hypothetical protein
MKDVMTVRKLRGKSTLRYYVDGTARYRALDLEKDIDEQIDDLWDAPTPTRSSWSWHREVDRYGAKACAARLWPSCVGPESWFPWRSFRAY